MIIKQKDKKNEIKLKLLDLLKEEHAFWSYTPESITIDSIGDDRLIALTMRYLDLQEIKLLFRIFSYKKIKDAWKKILVRKEIIYTPSTDFSLGIISKPRILTPILNHFRHVTLTHYYLSRSLRVDSGQAGYALAVVESLI